MPYVKKINGYNVKDEEARNQIRELQLGKANASDVERLYQDNASLTESLIEAENQITELQNNKADNSDIEDLQNSKADKSEIEDLQTGKADKTDMEQLQESMEDMENQFQGLEKKGSELTMVEYNDLSEDEKNTGMYYITDKNFIIYNGVKYGETQTPENELVYMDGVYQASNEENFCLEVIKAFLRQEKSNGFVNCTWEGNDYFTGTISKYASSSCQMIIGRANQGYIIKAKSNGSTITIHKIGE